MKTLFKSLAVAAMVLAPIAAEAQIGSISLRIDSRPYAIGIGGGFKAVNVMFTPSGGTSATSLADWIVWCIDDQRNVTVPGNYTYDLYTSAGFAATNLGGGTHDVTASEMKSIVSITDVFQTSVDGASFGTLADKQTRQNEIWNTFDNFTPLGSTYGNSSFAGNNWFVLWDSRSINSPGQTFAVRLNGDPSISVPEPSTFAMLAMGFVGIAGFARRRNNA